MMKKNPKPALALFLAAGAGIVIIGAFFLWNGGEAGDVPPDSPQELLDEKREATGPAIEDPVLVLDDEPESYDDQPSGDLVRIDLPATEDVRFLTVQVWDGEPGVPAAEAEVFFLEGFEGPELRDPYGQHWSDLAESRGERFRTDSQGRVELPPVREEWAMMTARRPGLYGYAWVRRQHREVETIILQPDETLTVKVVDGEDRPVAGVPVGVVQHVPEKEDVDKLWEQLKQVRDYKAKVEEYIRNNPGQREAAQGRMKDIRKKEAYLTKALREAKAGDAKKDGDGRNAARAEKFKPRITERPERRARRLTGDDGIAVFRHFQIYRHEREEWWPAHLVDKFEAALLMPLQRPETREFTGRPVPAETIELRMPPTGSIALRTVDLDGRPFTHPVHAQLRIDDPLAVPWSRVDGRKEQNDPAIVFPFSGLGLMLTAHCRLDDNDFRWNLPAFYGPSSPGERITIDMIVAPEAGMLHGRVLDGSGVSLAGVRPSFLISSHAGRLEGEEIVLGASGRFHLPFHVREPHASPFRLEIRREDVNPTVGTAMTLQTLTEGQVTDLGDLRIDALGLIANGTVVDDREQPIEGATVKLQREREVGGKQPRLEFVDADFTRCRTDENGCFELFGELEPGRYRLRAEAEEHFPAESADLDPDEECDLILDRKSRVLGTVLTPDWMPSQSVRVRLESAADPAQSRDDQVHDYEGKTYIYFDWVRPGIYNVLIRTQDFPDPFLRVDMLEVLPGEQGIHPRLEDLDLGAFLHRFEVVAADQDGNPIKPDRPLVAQIVRPDGEIGFVGFPWKNGRAEIFSVSSQLDVWPESRGYHAEPTVVVQGRSEIRFLRIPPVEVHVPGLRRIVGETPVWIAMTRQRARNADSNTPDELEIWDGSSERIAKWHGGGRMSYAQMGEDEIARIELSRDGIYRLDAYIGGRKTRLDFGTAEVELEPGEKPPRVTVTVDAEKVQSAIAGAGAGSGK